MTTLRAYRDNHRIATAIVLKTGRLLQVYPTKTPFATEAEWLTPLGVCTIHRTEKPVTPPYEMISHPIASYTPFQNLVRHFLHQTGLYPHDATVYVTVPSISAEPIPIEMKSETDTLYSPFVPKPADLPTTNLLFYRDSGDVYQKKPTQLLGLSHDPQRPTVVFTFPYKKLSNRVGTDTQVAMETLSAMGFNLLFHNRKGGSSVLGDDSLAALWALPGVVGIFGPAHQGRLLLYPTMAERKAFWIGKRLTVTEWLPNPPAAHPVFPSTVSTMSEE